MQHLRVKLVNTGDFRKQVRFLFNNNIMMMYRGSLAHLKEWLVSN